jgi:hypothetical protein
MECSAFRDEMLDVLYGEADAASRRRFEEHQRECGACREEIASLRRLRRDLAAWTVPSESRRLLTWVRSRPLRALAAAASLLLALGGSLALSGADVRYEDGRVSLRMGRPSSGVPASEVEALIGAAEARHRQEIAALRSEIARARDDGQAAMLARVSEMIRESEARQAVLVSASMADLREQSEAQRRYDLAQVGAGLSYLEGKTGLQVARTTELMGHVLQAAQKR